MPHVLSGQDLVLVEVASCLLNVKKENSMKLRICLMRHGKAVRILVLLISQELLVSYYQTLFFDPYLIADSDDFLSWMKFSLFDLPVPFWRLPLP